MCIRDRINTGRENRRAAKSMETYFLSLAVKLAPYIHMDEYKRGRQKLSLIHI